MTLDSSDKLQRAQNYCIRFVYKLNKYYHITQHYQELLILKLLGVRLLRILSFTHSALHGTTRVPSRKLWTHLRQRRR